jgi:hypothetical protein
MQTSGMAQENVTTARHSILAEDDDRALTSVFAAYTVAVVIWLLFATFYGFASVALVGLAYYVAARSSRNVAVQHKAEMDRAGAVQRGLGGMVCGEHVAGA